MLIKGGDLLYFVHIPRTGGRHMWSIFHKYDFVDNSQTDIEFRFNGMLKMHLPYPYYKTEYNFQNINTFAIIRNPINRIVSCISYDVSVNNSNIEDIQTYIEKQRSHFSYHNNLFTPQVNFLNPNIKLWKYEDGFNQNFCDWIEDNFGYKIQPVKQKKDKSLDNYEKVTLTLKQLDVIKNMYKLDFEVWDKFK